MQKFKLPVRPGDAPKTVQRAARAVGATRAADGNFYFEARNAQAAEDRMTGAAVAIAHEALEAESRARGRGRGRGRGRSRGRGSRGRQGPSLSGIFRFVLGVPKKQGD